MPSHPHPRNVTAPVAPERPPRQRTGGRRASDREPCRPACRRIVEALPDGVFWLEPVAADGAVVDFVVGEVNSVGADLLRMAPERMLGRRLSELLGVEEHLRWFQQCLEAWNTGETEEVTVSLHDACGQLGPRWVHLCGRPLEDGLLVVAREVTGQTLAERALAQAEARLHQTQAIAQVGSWSYDERTQRQWWSDETWRILGAQPGQAQSGYRTFLERIHPDDREGMKAVLREAARAGQPFSHECRILRGDGEVRILRSDGQLERDAHGDVVGYVGTVQDLTHIRAAEQRAQESELLRRRILERLPLILFALDREGRVVFAEGVGLQRQGLRPEDVLGRSVFELYAEYPDFLDPLRRALAGEALVTVNETHGALFERWLEPTRDADGRLSGAIGVSMDVTERHRAELERQKAERELRESQGLLRTVIDCLPQGLYVKDLQGHYVLVNDSLAKFHSLQPEALLGRTSFDMPSLTPEIAQALVRQDQRVVVTGRSAGSEELSVLRGDGAARWVRTLKMPLRDADGAVTGIVGIVEDITERKQLQSELEQSRALLQAIFDTFPARIQVEDRDGRQLLMNRAQAEAVGSSHATNREAAASLGLDAETVERIQGELRAVAESGLVYDYERQRSLTDGRQIHERIMRVPLKDADGHIRGVLNVGIDITAHKLTELQLRHAQKMEAVGQLAGGVAHDFNNLLQIIQGYGQLALEAACGQPRVLRALDHVLAAVERANNLTRQLLTFSRNRVLQPRNTDLNALVDNLLRMMRRLIGEDITLQHRPAEVPACIYADPGMIEQVLVNLCVNARDAMPQGGALTLCTDVVTVDEAFCRSHDLERPGRYILVTVTDTGTGIDPEHLHRIFEPFFTTKREGKGTGLGLSIAYGIVRQHGGTMRVHSEPGRGTIFSVYLPASECSAQSGGAIVPDLVPGGNETLLVAEDEEHVLGLLKELLESQGYRVLTARDGVEAIEVFQEHRERIDLVLLDVVMPRLGGREVLTRIREMAPSARILFSTGYMAHAIDADFLKAHGLAVVEKPYPPYKLFRAVRDVLDGAAG